MLPVEGPGAGAPSEEDLTDANRGDVSVPEKVVQGESVQVAVGAEHAGGPIDVYLFSAPVLLGTLIGWAATTVITAASEGAAAAATGGLSDTGGEMGVGVLAAAALLLTAGGGLVLATRRRAAAGRV